MIEIMFNYHLNLGKEDELFELHVKGIYICKQKSKNDFLALSMQHSSQTALGSLVTSLGLGF